jgi:two-component system LytT family sensor kinase
VLNTIFGNRRYLFIYLMLWVFISVIHNIILFLTHKFSLGIILTEGLLSNFLLGLFGIGLWIAIFYSNIKQQALFTKIINHILLIVIFLGLWMLCNHLILSSAFKDDSSYMYYLRSSIPWRVGNGLLFYAMIILSYYLLIFYQNFRDQVARESELKTLVKESELSSLKSQINPHFIFNSLNSISSLTILSPDKAREMIIKLSDFMRYALSQKEEKMTTLREELLNIRRYLDIEKIRFGNRLKVNENTDEQCMDKKLPGLILQPLIENAVKYGVYESVESAEIEINADCNAQALKVKIRNDYDPDFISKKGEGIGLNNIRSRLGIIYKNDNLITINKSGHIFEVTVIFPQ